jgi:hypothetical protein
MTLLYIGMGVDGNFSPKPLMVIFFRAPGGRGIYKKLLEPTQRPTNPYMGWATPPTIRKDELNWKLPPKVQSVMVNNQKQQQKTWASVIFGRCSGGLWNHGRPIMDGYFMFLSSHFFRAFLPSRTHHVRNDNQELSTKEFSQHASMPPQQPH